MSGLIIEQQDKRILIKRRPRTTIVMFSGGIDSTYTLVKLLKETDDEILAHHIHLVNPERRWKAEAEACHRIFERCRTEFRDFQYSESLVDHRGLSWFGYDMVTVGFEAGLVAHSYFQKHGRMPDRWANGKCVEEGYNNERFRHVKACVSANTWPHPPPEPFIWTPVTKREQMIYLGPELTAECWTCRRPNETADGLVACGSCRTCKLVEPLRTELFAGAWSVSKVASDVRFNEMGQ